MPCSFQFPTQLVHAILSCVYNIYILHIRTKERERERERGSHIIIHPSALLIIIKETLLDPFFFSFFPRISRNTQRRANVNRLGKNIYSNKKSIVHYKEVLHTNEGCEIHVNVHITGNIMKNK